MKYINELRNATSAEQLEEQMRVLQESAVSQNLPVVLILKRKALRNFPDGTIVALYYAEQIDKFVTVPHLNIGISEDLHLAEVSNRERERLSAIQAIISNFDNKHIPKHTAIRHLKDKGVANPEKLLLGEMIVVAEGPPMLSENPYKRLQQVHKRNKAAAQGWQKRAPAVARGAARALVPYYDAGEKYMKGDTTGAAVSAATDTAILGTGYVAGKLAKPALKALGKTRIGGNIARRFNKARGIGPNSNPRTGPRSGTGPNITRADNMNGGKVRSEPGKPNIPTKSVAKPDNMSSGTARAEPGKPGRATSNQSDQVAKIKADAYDGAKARQAERQSTVDSLKPGAVAPKVPTNTSATASGRPRSPAPSAQAQAASQGAVASQRTVAQAAQQRAAGPQPGSRPVVNRTSQQKAVNDRTTKNLDPSRTPVTTPVRPAAPKPAAPVKPGRNPSNPDANPNVRPATPVKPAPGTPKTQQNPTVRKYEGGKPNTATKTATKPVSTPSKSASPKSRGGGKLRKAGITAAAAAAAAALAKGLGNVNTRAAGGTEKLTGGNTVVTSNASKKGDDSPIPKQDEVPQANQDKNGDKVTDKAEVEKTIKDYLKSLNQDATDNNMRRKDYAAGNSLGDSLKKMLRGKGNKTMTQEARTIGKIYESLEDDSITHMILESGEQVEVDFAVCTSIMELYCELNEDNQERLIENLGTLDGFEKVARFAINR